MVGFFVHAATEFAKCLVEPVRRPFRHMWDYEDNLENLRNEVGKLEAKRNALQLSIRRGEDPMPDVKIWQVEADRIIPQALNLVNPVNEYNPQQANIQCCKVFSCSNLKNRCQFSKKVADMLDAVVRIKQETVGFNEVSYPTIPEQTSLQPSKGHFTLDSRKSILKDIIDALSDPDVNMVGIYGMGGVGKTTLAREVASEARKVKVASGATEVASGATEVASEATEVASEANQHYLFDKIVFVEVSKSPDIQNIQGAIADNLGLQFKEETVPGRASRLSDQLKKEGNVLLILDNIWEGIDFEKVGIPFQNDRRGLKLLLTTRSRDVLTNQMDSQCNFLVDTLKGKEAWGLFKKTAGTCIKQRHLKSIAKEVAKECGDMPLAIVAVAKALKNKEEYAWINALEELKSPPLERFKGTITKEVYTCIKLSYDYLDNEELKEIFLLCSCMGRTNDASIRDLFMYGLGLGFFKRSNTLEKAQCKAEDLVKKLKDNSLLLDAPNETSEHLSHVIPNDERFAIHDLICDVARSIVCEKGNVCIVTEDIISCSWAKKNMLKNCTSITLHNIGELPEDLAFPQLEFFYMKSKTNFFLRITNDFFAGMSRLKVLHLIEMNLSPLPTSFSNLVNLQTLCLDACQLGDIGGIGKLVKLEILSFRGSKIEKLSEEMCQLTSMRLLDLTNCSTLKIIPPNVISCFTQLEALYMHNTSNRCEDGGLKIGGILDELKHLRDRLTTLEICIPNVKMSEGLLSSHLKRYIISIDNSDWFRPPTNSRRLRVKLNASDKVHEVISQLKGIKRLELCADLKDDFTDSKQSVSLDVLFSLESLSDEALFSLESLSLEDLKFGKICKVPLAAKSFCQLRTITVIRCDKLTNIFSFSIDRVLPKLQEIEVSCCENMEEIFAIESEDDVNNSELIQFSQLCSVTLEGLPKLKSFCHRVKTTSQLQLTSSTNDREITLFNEEVEVPNLEKLRISNMDNLEKIWHNQLVKDSFCKLKSLEVQGCNKLLNVFPSNICERLLSSLESLQVRACGSLQEIFDLQGLSISSNEEITRVIGNHGDAIIFIKLKSLDLYELPSLTSFCSSNFTLKFPSLETLTVQGCPNLKSFSWGDLTMQNLQRVKIDEESVELRSDFNLNTAIQQSHQKANFAKDKGASSSHPFEIDQESIQQSHKEAIQQSHEEAISAEDNGASSNDDHLE